MFTLQTMPKETAAELLRFLAEAEIFDHTEKKLQKSITAQEIKALLRELARELQKEVVTSRVSRSEDSKPLTTHKTQDVLSRLSPEEGETLLTAFGIHDDE